MRAVSILEQFDRIEPTDWCRPLQLTTSGYSDNIPTRNCYSGTPENNVEWVLVKHVFGKGWYGKTVHDLSVCLGEQYEFVRGEVPVAHRLNMRDYSQLA